MGVPNVLVAAGLSYWSWVGNWQKPQDLADPTVEQAAILASAGADLLMLEMMVDVESLLVSYDAAATTGLPVLAGLSCKPGPDGEMMLLRGGTLSEALDALKGRDVPMLNIMHTEVDDIDACLDIVEAHWSGPISVYAHSARWQGEADKFSITIAPEAHAHHASRWLERGISLVGGWCGLDVDHITALRPLFQAEKSSASATG